ncbi:hypothetical protein Salmuc_00314 [Salipiger mucosus DSM 16094]|uniref:Uncharacterized protein n=2 Tax=Salipiger mucosus TaxID=263378 RepID=S9Q9W4_9RHOB|nr:hypothetical protein Salmuc_00314 [Salipiger mucosus DSM 16094]
MPASHVLDISIDPAFHPYIPASLLRLSYLYPELDFGASEQGVNVSGTSGADPARLEREVTYQIYREKIFQQTLPMRQSLYEMLTT